jgi:hypothetical protein
MGQDDWREASQRNAKLLADEIDRLDGGHWSIGLRQWGSFWAHVKEINQLFKTTKPLAPEDRSRLFERLSEICEAAKEGITRSFDGSSQKRNVVEGKIDDAASCTRADLSEENLEKARERLDEARQWMTDGWKEFNATTQLLTFNEGKMTREDRDACWQKWKQANDDWWSRRRELQGDNASEFRRQAQDAYNEACSGDTRKAKEMVQAVQRDMKGKTMAPDQFVDVRHWLDKAWAKASEVAQERHGAYQERKEQTRKHLEAEVEKLEGWLEKAIENRDQNETRVAGARTEEFADEVRGWIEQDEEKIQRYTKWLEEAKEKLEGL